MTKEFGAYLISLGDTWAENFSEARFIEDGFGADPAFGGFIAEEAGQPLGYLLHTPTYDSDLACRVLFVIDLWVRPWTRRLGVGRKLMARLTPAWNRAVRITFIVAAVLIYAAGLVLLFRPSLVSHSAEYVMLFQNGRLGVLRPLAAPISVAGTYFLVRRFEGPLVRTVGKVLIPFGRNSLYVYVAQSFVVFMVPFAFAPQSFLLNTVFDFGVIAVMYLGVRTRFLAFLIPKA